MTILGTPGISLNFGIPEWAVVCILVGTYLIIRLCVKLYKTIKIRNQQNQSSIELGDIESDSIE